MKRPVQYATEFTDALRANLEYLSERGDLAWLELLDADLAELEFWVSTFPTAGKRMAARGTVELRKLRLKRTPFIAWYVADMKNRKTSVTFLRLFHVRQQTARPSF